MELETLRPGPGARLRRALGVGVAAALAAGAPAWAAESRVGDFRARMEKWVQTRQLLSEEKSSWEVERETLEATRDLLQQQKEILQAEIATLEATGTQADDERVALLLRRGEYQRASALLAERVRRMEEYVRALAPRFPEPLQRKLDVLLVQIPDDPELSKLSLGQRLVNVLGILAQAEKFDGTATFVGETRAVKGDQKVQIRTLYWGLGQAFYVDALGETAGIGQPGPAGWEFREAPEIADAARRLLDIYEGNVDAIQFVKLPAALR